MANIINLEILDFNKTEFVFYLIASIILKIKEKFVLFQVFQKLFCLQVPKFIDKFEELFRTGRSIYFESTNKTNNLRVNFKLS